MSNHRDYENAADLDSGSLRKRIHYLEDLIKLHILYAQRDMALNKAPSAYDEVNDRIHQISQMMENKHTYYCVLVDREVV